MKLDLTNTKTRTYNIKEFLEQMKIDTNETLKDVDFSINIDTPNTIIIKTEQEN